MPNFERLDLTSYPPHPTKDAESERVLNGWRDALTGSLCETFQISGSISDNIGLYIGGPRYNDGCDKIITSVTVQCLNSGSGGVTRIDVRKTNGSSLSADKSIFSNAVFKAILSSSAGDFGVGRTTTFVAASASWLRGETIACPVEAAAGAAGVSAQTGVTVRVWWKPSGSF